MQTNTNKHHRQRRSITDGRAGPSNIAPDLMQLIMPDWAVDDTGISMQRKRLEYARGRSIKASLTIQKYVRFWFSEIGQLIRDIRDPSRMLVRLLHN